MKYRSLVVLITLAVVLAACPAVQVAANGDALEIFRGQNGPYEIVVGILPERPAVGTVHFSVSVLDAETMFPIEDAQVRIVANNPQGEPAYQSPALNTSDAPRFYEGNIIFRSPGQWSLTIMVNSQSREEAEVTFPLNVQPAPVEPGPAGAFVLAVVVLALLGGTAYLWYSARRHRSASDASQ